jgi:hypothetical protein
MEEEVKKKKKGKPGPKTPEAIAKVTQNLPEGKGGDAWGFTEEGKKALAIANHMHQLKHGLYATIPIYCKGKECPYAKSCRLVSMGVAPKGEVCPIEASTIEQLVKMYAEEMEVNMEDAVKISLIRELVDTEISILRCDKKLATDPDVVKNVVVAVTEEGTPITQPQVNKAYELQQKLVRQRHQTLRLLNSTPKDRAEIEGNTQIDPSVMIGEMRERLMKMKSEEDSTVDITPEK